MKKSPIIDLWKKEVDSNTVTIRKLDSNKQENMQLKEFKNKFSLLSKAPI